MVRGTGRTRERPAFRTIADDLRARIIDGTYPEGDQLPSETELLTRYGTARMTVRQAIDVLRGEGLVVTEQGRGAFVRTRPPVRRLAHDRFSRARRAEGRAAFLANAETAGYVPGVELVRVERCPASSEVSRRLGIREGTSVIVRERRYLADGEPVETATSYVPWSIAKGTRIAKPDTGPGGIYARIEEAGHPLVRFTEEVTARMPTPEEARSLELAEGVPIFQVLRLAFTQADVAVEVCDTVMAADRYALVYELPAH